MDLGCFAHCFSDVVGRGTSVEVDGDGMLARGNIDDRWGGREEGAIGGKV